MADETGVPWWKKSAFAILISATIPVATLVQGWMQTNRELALQEQQQIQQFRTQYMSVLAEAGVEGIEVLADFIADTEQDPTIRDWATKQREKARGKMVELDKQAAEEQAKAQLAQARAQAAMERRKRAEARADRAGDSGGENLPARVTATREVEAARREFATAQTAAAISEAKAARARSALGGRGFRVDRFPDAIRLRDPEPHLPLAP